MMKIFSEFLVVFVFGSVLGSALGSAPNPSEKYPRHLQLKSDGAYVVYWKYSGLMPQDTITFEIIAETTGWIGFGLSPQGGMPGSDIIIGGVDDSTQNGYLYDRFATDFAKPELDAKSDYTLIDHKQENGFTMIKFSRRLDTCDPQDFPITNDTMRFIWAISADDPKNADDIMKHEHGNRGTRSVILLDPNPHEEGQIPLGAKIFDLRVHNVTVPSDYHTLYWCEIFQAPDWGGMHYMLRYEPLIEEGHEPYVHHALVYQCDNDMAPYAGLGAPCFDRSGRSSEEMDSCVQKYLAGWAVGGGGSTFPDDMGYPLMMKTGEPTYIMLEVHYDNAQYHPEIIDNSGMRMYLTEKKPSIEIGSLTIGMGTNPEMLLIPPGQSSFTHYAFCSPICTKTYPSEGIIIYDALLHEHLTGKALRLRHFRNGIELPPIFADNHYDFNYQQIRYANREIRVLPDDTILLECEYDTSKHESPVYGGESTINEMCMALIDYYPKNEGVPFACAAGPIVETYLEAMGTKEVSGDEESDDLMVENPWEPGIPLNFTTFTDRYFSDFQDTKAEKLQKAVIEGKYFQYCSDLDLKTNKKSFKNFKNEKNYKNHPLAARLSKKLQKNEKNLKPIQMETEEEMNLPMPKVPYQAYDICKVDENQNSAIKTNAKNLIIFTFIFIIMHF